MAALLNGLDDGETLAMTRAMIASGETVTFGDLGRPTVDKHSTGGVADGVTLVFAPLAAALGWRWRSCPDAGSVTRVGRSTSSSRSRGCGPTWSPIASRARYGRWVARSPAQSSRLVPADGALYALRDATATVPSVPLIAASVMSKKLAVALGPGSCST